MDGDGGTLFNPSTFQNLAENDDEHEDEEEQRQIEQQIEERLRDMDGVDINLEDDEDDSIYGAQDHRRPPNPHQHLSAAQHHANVHPQSPANHFRQNTNYGDDMYQQRNQFSSTPFSFGVGIASGTPQSSSGRVNFDLIDERQYLLNPQDKGSDNLEILYHARGEEIKRLKAELNELNSIKESEVRSLQHEVALLKGDKMRLESNLEHHESVAQGQSDENRELRRQLENLESKLMATEESKRDIVAQLESSDLIIKTLQSQLSDLQKSETILKAKQHHEQVVRSLKERHETETHNMQQENDRLNLKIKHIENELDSVRSKNCKLQRDHELLMIEKSDTIKELQERLDLAQKRLQQNVSETSSQGYVNIKAMQERLRQDQEKYATELLTYQSEIDQLKLHHKRKDDEAVSLRRAMTKYKQDQEELLNQKSELIAQYQQRLSESETRLNKLIEESSRAAGSANQLDKLRHDTRKLTTELERAHLDIQDRETEIASLSSKLTESNEKYSALKKKVRQYQAHCKSKELKYTERIRVAEEEYKQKLTSLRDKMEEGYASKGMRVEKEVLEMKHFFDQELARLMQLGFERDPIRLLPEPRSERDDFDDGENVGPLSRTTVPQPVSGAGGLGGRPLSASSASEELARLFQNAKLDVRDQLKMPSERYPLSHLNGN